MNPKPFIWFVRWLICPARTVLHHIDQCLLKLALAPIRRAEHAYWCGELTKEEALFTIGLWQDMLDNEVLNIDINPIYRQIQRDNNNK